MPPTTSAAELDALHRESVDLLRTSGMRIRHPETVEWLQGRGCRVEDIDRVCFPTDLVEQAIATSPQQVEVFSRDGKRRLELGGDHPRFATGLDLPHTMDLVRSERRAAVLADVTAYSRLSEALDQIDLVGSMAREAESTPASQDAFSFVAMVQHTGKPIVQAAQSLSGLETVIRMAEVVTGGGTELSARPFFVTLIRVGGGCELSAQIIEQLWMLVDRRLPWICAPTISLGAADFERALVAANAEVLGLLTAAQLRRPGSPAVLGANPGPHALRGALRLTDLYRQRYELPAWAPTGISSSKLPDIQAGIESALSVLAAQTHGTSLGLGLGSLESGVTGSFEMMVVADQVIGYVRRLSGLEGGDPVSLFDSSDFASWIEAGRPNMIRSARDRAIEIVGTETAPSLSESILEELRAMAVAADDGPGPVQ